MNDFNADERFQCFFLHGFTNHAHFEGEDNAYSFIVCSGFWRKCSHNQWTRSSSWSIPPEASSKLPHSLGFPLHRVEVSLLTRVSTPSIWSSSFTRASTRSIGSSSLTRASTQSIGSSSLTRASTRSNGSYSLTRVSTRSSGSTLFNYLPIVFFTCTRGYHLIASPITSIEIWT